MNITIENTEYEFDVERAKELGVLKSKRLIELSLTEDEAAVLHIVMKKIGGNPQRARGCCNIISQKLLMAFNGDCPKTKFSTQTMQGYDTIYFKD